MKQLLIIKVTFLIAVITLAAIVSHNTYNSHTVDYIHCGGMDYYTVTHGDTVNEGIGDIADYHVKGQASFSCSDLK